MARHLSRGLVKILGLTLASLCLYHVYIPKTAKQKRTHSAQVNLQLTPEHDRLIREAAEHAGQTLTNWIRGVLVRSAREELKT